MKDTAGLLILLLLGAAIFGTVTAYNVGHYQGWRKGITEGQKAILNPEGV